LNTDYDLFGHQLAQAGLNVAIGCWFGATPATPTSPLIGCAGGPIFKGVTDSAVADLDALVAAAKDGLNTGQLALAGFSRGGGIVMLRAATGASEPVISIAGMLEGWTNIGTAPGEVDVVSRAQAIHAPVLLLHGTDDAAVPVEQAQHMEVALRANHEDVTAKYYPGGQHGLASDPPTRADLITQITAFLCLHHRCPSATASPGRTSMRGPGRATAPPLLLMRVELPRAVRGEFPPALAVDASPTDRTTAMSGRPGVASGTCLWDQTRVAFMRRSGG
jgi:dienelactone hydrolase